MIMALPRRFFSIHPDPALTEAIEKHRRALAASRRTTNMVTRIGLDAQRAAEEAIELLNRSWMPDHGRSPPAPLA